MSDFTGVPNRAHSPPPRGGTTTPTPRSPVAKRSKTDGGADAGSAPRVRTPTRSPRRSSGGFDERPGRSPSDRFIPHRTSMDFDEANHALSVVASPQRKKDPDVPNARPVEVEFRRAMRRALLPRSSGGRRSSAGGDGPVSQNVFRCSEEAPRRSDRFRSALQVIADPRQDAVSGARTAALARPVPTKPSRILDAPDIVDDYYLNLLSWSSSNVLAVALANNVYLWNAATNEVSELLQLEQGDCVTSVSWAPGGSHLCVGTDSAAVQLWDASRMTMVRSMRGNPVSRCVNSGSRDALVLQHDARARQHRTATLVGHQQEVCGLSWSADGATLASGGNENFLCLWDAARSGDRRSDTSQPAECAPRATLRQHQAAVKALSWCPMHRNLLASGGGTADRTIKFWNAHTGALLNSVDTGSQVCALLWSRHHKELVSSHGFSQNQLCLWRYPSMTKLCELTGHTARVLHLAQSPDGETVVSAAADETLRFWSIFGGGPTSPSRRKGQMRALGMSSIGGGMSIR